MKKRVSDIRLGHKVFEIKHENDKILVGVKKGGKESKSIVWFESECCVCAVPLGLDFMFHFNI